MLLSFADFEKIFADIPFNRMLGLKVDSIKEDKIVMSFGMKPELVGNFVYGILHGGVISSVIDMAGGVAAIASAVKKNHEKSATEIKAILAKASTINLHINYIHPGKGESFIATSRILRSGNKISFTQTDLYNEKNTLIASGAGTYMIG